MDYVQIKKRRKGRFDTFSCFVRQSVFFGDARKQIISFLLFEKKQKKFTKRPFCQQNDNLARMKTDNSIVHVFTLFFFFSEWKESFVVA